MRFPSLLAPAVSFLLISAAFVGCDGGVSYDDGDPAPDRPVFTWISSAVPPGETNLRIAKTVSDGATSTINYLTDSPHNDYKPALSPDGSKIVFFRSYSQDESFFLWNSSICVMNADGSGLHEVIGHDFMNTEPYWTRDGSNRVTWTRMIDSSEGEMGTYVYRTAWDGQPGQEQQISETNWEWSNSSLEDGRIFVSRGDAYFLMTPNPGGTPTYEEISCPDSYHFLHKLTISNDETMIAYMKKKFPEGDDYRHSEIVYADFDASVPAITNEVIAVPLDPLTFTWYVSISPDNQYLIYAENGKIMLHDLSTGVNRRISTKSDVEYRYPTFVGSVK